MANDTATNRDQRWRLEDEREFLVRSLRDADAEHEAGDLSETDYKTLRRRDADRLATVEAALQGLDAEATDRESADKNTEHQAPGHQAPDHNKTDGESADASTEAKSGRVPEEKSDADAAEEPDQASPGATKQRTRRRRRNLLGVIGVLAIAAALVVLVVALVSPRLPGESSSGSVNLSPSQEVERQLEQAATLVNQGKLANALTVYQIVLREDPHQPQALAESGWIEYESGVTTGSSSLIAKGRASVEASVRAQPDGYAGHLYLGTIDLQQDHDPAAAVGQYQLFLSEDPPASLISQAATFLRQAYTEDGQPVPSQVPAASPTTTAPPKSSKGG
jgi:hypothetical protein